MEKKYNTIFVYDTYAYHMYNYDINYSAEFFK